MGRAWQKMDYDFIQINILLNQVTPMDPNDEIRKRRQKLRNSVKLSLTKSGHVGTQLPENLDNYRMLAQNQKIEKQHHEPVGRTRRKTSLDIRDMGNQFDMFQCNQVYIFNDFIEMYDIGKKIDEGAQSVVYQAVEKKTNKKFAVKVIKKKDQDIIRSLKTQFRILKNLDHPNIIKAYNLFIDEKIGISHLVLKYSESPNLRFHLLKNRFLKETEVAEILTVVLSVVAYLHSQGICHRDIKPENILFNPTTREIKLIDFEISKMIKYDHQKLEMLTNVGTLYYKAPEMFSSTYYHQQVDVWAIGVVCYEMIMGDYPFKHKYKGQVVKLIKETEPKYDTSNATDLCITFMKKCLEKDPLKRFTAFQALKSPFMLKYSSISSTNSSPMRRKNSEQHIRNSFGIEVSKCFNEDSGLKNTESLDIDSGIRLKINQSNSGNKHKSKGQE